MRAPISLEAMARLLKALQQCRAYGDLRIGQALINALGDADALWNAEDDSVIAAIERLSGYTRGIHPRRRDRPLPTVSKPIGDEVAPVAEGARRQNQTANPDYHVWVTREPEGTARAGTWIAEFHDLKTGERDVAYGSELVSKYLALERLAAAMTTCPQCHQPEGLSQDGLHAAGQVVSAGIRRNHER